MLYIGSCSGSFYALDRETGFPLWTYNTAFDGQSANFHGNLLLADGTIVVGTDSGETGWLYAFDAESGDLLWSQKTPGGFPSDPARHESRALAVTMSGELRCVDLKSGETAWTHGGDGKSMLQSAVLIDGQRAVYSLPSGEITALNAADGRPIWQRKIDGKPNTAIARIGDSFYVGDVEGRIYRLSSRDGSVQATFEAVGPVYGTLTPAGDCLVALWGMNTVGCVDPDLGSVKWSHQVESTWSSFHPLIWNNGVLVGTETGEIHAFDLKTGERFWSHQLEGEIKGLGSEGDVLYVGTLEGRVTALRVPLFAGGG